MNKPVFISYSSLDEDLGKFISSELTNRNIGNWFGPVNIDAGKNYAQCIPEAIRDCSVFLLIASKNSVGSLKESITGSNEVAKEVELAWRSNCNILPLKIDSALDEGCDDRFAYHLSILQWLDVSQLSFDKKIANAVLKVTEMLDEEVQNKKSYLDSNAEVVQKRNIRKIENALKNGDSFIAQRLLSSIRFSKKYDNQILLLKIVALMIKSDVRTMRLEAVNSILQQLDLLTGSEYEHISLYLKAIFSIVFFKENCIYDASGGFNHLSLKAENLPHMPAKFIRMTQNIKGAENVELRWKNFR